VDSATGSLIDAIRQARQEAMMSGAPTLVCPGPVRSTCKGGRWADGWFGAYARDWPAQALSEPFVVDQPAGFAIVGSTGRTHLRFHTDGTARETNQTLTVCLVGKPAHAQTIIVALNGRVRQVDATAANAARCAASK
jgi:Tfp pilus assembly protein FimT